MPRLVPGTPDPWTIDPWAYHRALRTWYVTVARDLWHKGLPHAHPSVGVDDLPWFDVATPAGVASTIGTYRQRPRKLALNPAPRPLQGHVVVEVEVDDRLDVLDFMGLTDQGGQVRLDPGWREDCLAWIADIDPSWEREIGRPFEDSVIDRSFEGWEAFDWWAVARKKQAVQYHQGTLCIFDRKAVRIVGEVPAIGPTPTHASLVLDHAQSGEVPEDVLCWYGIRKGMTADNQQRAARHLDEARQALRVYGRINGPMRRADHTLLQDLELDRLSILAVRKAFDRLAAYATAWRGIDGPRLSRVVDLWLEPGASVAGRPRPPGQEGWPDAAVEIAALGSSRSTLGSDPLGTATSSIESLRATHGDEPELTAFLLFPLLQAVGWEKGRKQAERVMSTVWMWDLYD
jgi:hypothetical protein